MYSLFLNEKILQLIHLKNESEKQHQEILTVLKPTKGCICKVLQKRKKKYVKNLNEYI